MISVNVRSKLNVASSVPGPVYRFSTDCWVASSFQVSEKLGDLELEQKPVVLEQETVSVLVPVNSAMPGSARLKAALHNVCPEAGD